MFDNKNKNFCAVPSKEGFWELFDYFWDNGVGKDLSDNAEPVSWTATSLADALDQQPSQTSILNWRKRKHLPRKDQLHRMCRILFDQDHQLRKAWADAFIAARRDEELRRNIANKPVLDTNVDAQQKSDPLAVEPDPKGHSRRSLLYFSVLLVSLLLVLVLFAFTKTESKSFGPLNISNIRFCTGENFSERYNECTVETLNFPNGTQKIYVSFSTSNIPYGDPFSRRWYRDGEKWLERNDFFDDAWQNYTWIHNSNGHDSGEYVMRVIVDEQVFSGRFTIGGL